MSSLDFTSMRDLQKQMRRMEMGFDSFLREFLLQQGTEAVNKAKENTPANEGAIRNAWSLDSVRREGNKLIVTIVNSLPNASGVEYGHSQGGFWVEGRFMATLAIEDVVARMPGRFQEAFNSWLASLGGNGF